MGQINVVKPRSAGIAVSLTLVAASLLLFPLPAQADTAPPDPSDPTNPPTMSADPLPTAQIGTGVVWSQVVIGNTVYAGGEFSTARPPGVAQGGAGQVTRNNLVAYDIRTGALLPWAPSTNGTVQTLERSPDGTRVYVGGTFTTVNGVTRRRIAAVDATTGALITGFNPNPDAQVSAIAATSTTVYFGGVFGVAGGQARSRAAAVRVSDNALLPWAPVPGGGNVEAMETSPSGDQVLLGGHFTTLNGSANPGYGLGSVDPVNGTTNLPWASNPIIHNGGNDGAINFLVSDGDVVYASGYTFGRAGGTLEGVAKMSWAGGALQWVDDCHGDTYSVKPMDGVVYKVGHAHYCGNLPGGFDQTDPWQFYRGMALSQTPTGVVRTEYNGYTNFAGQSAPSILHWFPDLRAGTFTGQTQAAWSLAGNNDYLVAGGEFTRVGAANQQGLVRFARRTVAGNPNAIGGELVGSQTNPTVTSPGAGQALVCWQTNWDRDNEFLTYSVIRNNVINSPIDVRTIGTRKWDEPYACYLDSGLTPGQSVNYRIFAEDPLGNETRSNQVAVTVSGAGAVDDYAKAVTKSGPWHYWTFDDAAGTTAADYTGLEGLNLAGGVSLNQPGAMSGRTAARFNGTSAQTGYNSVAVQGPFWYTVEAWFNTTTTQGGKIVGFGNAQTGSSSTNNNDRHLYMDTSGRINFGSRQSTYPILTSQSGLNNGQWHHAVGVVGDNGMSLYIDGTRVGYNSAIHTGRSFVGYWRVGGDNIAFNWNNNPPSDYFNGSIDEVAVYNRAITGNEVRDHYVASGRTLSGLPIPADAYGKAVYDAGPDAYWRLGETSGSTAGDSSGNGTSGGYLDNQGGAGPAKGGASGVGVGSDRSASFDGAGDYVASSTSLTSPSRFSGELWFKTSTTQGGKLFGFGNNRTTNSSGTSYDRHVFMTNAGKLRFGVQYQGNQYAVESAASYNDNEWHHVVAELGRRGMHLYVDGVDVASSPQSAAQTYTGYWRVGGDNLSGWASRPSSDYFAGQIDEPAFYTRALTSAEVLDHFSKAGGVIANVPPHAAFTSSVTNLSVSFNSSGSSDADGTIASYAWSFGDGGTSTQANPSHAYAASGTYTVELTVTDDDGESDTVSHQVSPVDPPPNQLPVAAFDSSVAGLVASFDSSDSDDPDGTIASYAWDFGDGGSSTQPNPSHTYTADGTYTVELTVTDDDGASDTVSHDVSVATPTQFAVDAFGRTATNSWGNADLGGAWTITGPTTRFSVSGGTGKINLNTAGAGTWVYLNSVSARDLAGTLDFSIDKPATGGGMVSSVAMRRVGTSEYRAAVTLLAGGAVRIQVSRVVNGTETRLGNFATVSGLTYNAGDVLRLEWSVQGTGTTTLNAKVWKVGDPEPAVDQVSRTDTTAELQGPGAFGIQAYLSASSTNAPVLTSYDNLALNAL